MEIQEEPWYSARMQRTGTRPGDIVFVDLTKAFDSFSRAELWVLLYKVGLTEEVINVIRSFHDGCIFAAPLFSIVMTAVIYDAFHE